MLGLAPRPESLARPFRVCHSAAQEVACLLSPELVKQITNPSCCPPDALRGEKVSALDILIWHSQTQTGDFAPTLEIELR
jgi:hypothetical protein